MVELKTAEHIAHFMMGNISLSRFDKKFVESLQLLKQVTTNQVELFYRIIYKYRRQLGKHELDADKLFDNGKYLDYLNPYYIVEPHVATHLWLVEQCNHFPIIGGDWPWIHTHVENKVISPFRLEFSSYERFMKDKGIHGIGNMISYSLESSVKLIQLHLDNHINNESISIFKAKMYKTMYPELVPRLKSHGWEEHKTKTFNILRYKINLSTSLKPTDNYIKWNETIKALLNTSINENNKF